MEIMAHDIEFIIMGAGETVSDLPTTGVPVGTMAQTLDGTATYRFADGVWTEV